ncbi:hypothetical protein P170DRAFT_179469 [Aspergillus steynii IBT 23096]|uniref:Uncharacterized protein n=1 Tax=Aspergillus steynii IBT 23096 TaxID=1392250 RepID=A0A2I2G8S8_9EURO|nr:uncharacterized protein P170DRAFT_179469 [Aspergillus steynii IBT 23096]PLB49290.1 hypothetical protein P170DRAFT_179469 [Aspergillus steynii IBT 23096]
MVIPIPNALIIRGKNSSHFYDSLTCKDLVHNTYKHVSILRVRGGNNLRSKRRGFRAYRLLHDGLAPSPQRAAAVLRGVPGISFVEAATLMRHDTVDAVDWRSQRRTEERVYPPPRGIAGRVHATLFEVLSLQRTIVTGCIPPCLVDVSAVSH